MDFDRIRFVLDRKVFLSYTVLRFNFFLLYYTETKTRPFKSFAKRKQVVNSLVVGQLSKVWEIQTQVPNLN